MMYDIFCSYNYDKEYTIISKGISVNDIEKYSNKVLKKMNIECQYLTLYCYESNTDKLVSTRKVWFDGKKLDW